MNAPGLTFGQRCELIAASYDPACWRGECATYSRVLPYEQRRELLDASDDPRTGAEDAR